ncbi:MAG: carbohydrate ABC transporter permease [Chloroflexi bacterium]|nr:carbohydrate ABC transporter permease [Chloroflexota bacterium]MBK6711874.1 carbohydrate ABC transporter permease [Chloroflexota bacterium]MBK8931696.1 carbohydrate ABC transporter permease [Chloroflexota bacterium]MBP7590280.1 carbohydrate ABC transporter permease [Chloroflexota bacterium]
MLMYIILIVGALIAIVPFLFTISVSLMNLTEATGRALLPSTPQWGNYAKAWRDADFGLYFWNSVRIAFITVTGQVVFCTLAAYAFAQFEFPGKNFLFALLLSTLILPEAITWVPNFITVAWLGRVTPMQWINNWPALTIPFMASAFSILILRQFFQQIPSELWDSAQIDGAGYLRYLVRVVVPLSKPAIVSVILFSFIGSWNALAWPILVTTTPDWRPISYGLYNFVDEGGAQTHLRMAGAVITILPLIIVYFFTQKQFTEGIATAGLKG